MKIVLSYYAPEDKSAYGKVFVNNIGRNLWHYPIGTLLPVGSEIHFLDKITGKPINLEVIKLHFNPEDKLLQLQVVMEDEDATNKIGQNDFEQYIQRTWVKVRDDEYEKMS